MNNDLISRSYLKNLPFERVIHTDFGDTAIPIEEIDNAPTVERPQGEFVEKYEKILQIVEHWNDKSSSFVSACEAFEKILDVTKGGAV